MRDQSPLNVANSYNHKPTAISDSLLDFRVNGICIFRQRATLSFDMAGLISSIIGIQLTVDRIIRCDYFALTQYILI